MIRSVRLLPGLAHGVVAGGELPGDRGGGGDLDDGVQAEADQRGGGGDRAGGDGDDRLDDVVGDGRGDQQPYPAGERVAAGRGRGRGIFGGHQQQPFVVGVGAGAVGLDGDHGGAQVVERVAEAFVGQFVAGAAAVGHGDDQAAVAQAGQVVRQPGAGDAEGVGEVGGVGGGLAQGEQDPAADRVGERAAEPGQHLDVGGNSQHTHDSTRNPEFRKSWDRLSVPASAAPWVPPGLTRRQGRGGGNGIRTGGRRRAVLPRPRSTGARSARARLVG